MSVARRVVAENRKFDDLSEVAKLFNMYKGISEENSTDWKLYTLQVSHQANLTEISKNYVEFGYISQCKFLGNQELQFQFLEIARSTLREFIEVQWENSLKNLIG